eukprot:5722597-Amphidinium_carterae.4
MRMMDQSMSDSEESEVNQDQERDEPEIIRVQVRAHQRTLQERVVNVRSHTREKEKVEPNQFPQSEKPDSNVMEKD